MSNVLIAPSPGSGRLKQMLRKAMYRLLRFLVLVVAVMTLFIIITPQGRAGFHTALFVTQTLEVPIKPQSWLTDDSLRQEVHYRTPDGVAVADIYRLPDGKPRAAALLSLGAIPKGLDDPNVINLGYALTRAGYVAMFHWSPTMAIHHNIDPVESDKLVQAFQYLAGREYVDQERVGLGGFCVGASLALVASSSSRIRDQVDFVNAFGPFFDAESLLLQAEFRTVVYYGERTPWEPDPFTLRILANELIETLDNPSDVEVLTRHYLYDQPTIAAERAALSPSGRTAARLMDGVKPQEAEELYATLPSDLREDLARVSPSTHVGDIRARIFVMHNHYDTLVPAAESRRMLEAMRDRVKVRFTEFVAFDHTAPGGGGPLTILGQAARLYRHMYDIIRIAS